MWVTIRRDDKLSLSLRAAGSLISEGRTIWGLGVYSKVFGTLEGGIFFERQCITFRLAFF
jgi:hypothetical protein